MIVNRIKRNYYPGLLLGGVSIADAQSRFLPVNEITAVKDALPSNGIIIVIYDDVPLITEKLIKTLCLSCRTQGGFSVGDGFVTRTDYEGPLTKVNVPETEKFSPERYSFFLREFRKRIIAAHKKNGVIFRDEGSVFLDFDVRIGEKTVIFPNVSIEGVTYIGKNAVIGSNSQIKDCIIGDGCVINSSVLTHSRVGEGTTVGPFAMLREGASVGNKCRIGDFVEIKNSILHDGVKAAHLAYIGDAEVGECTNVGCGTVFCNYDGQKKHHSTVGDNVFIGANTNLVAPIKIGDNVFIAAGSTVTEDVPENSFVIARTVQTVRPNKRKT